MIITNTLGFLSQQVFTVKLISAADYDWCTLKTSASKECRKWLKIKFIWRSLPLIDAPLVLSECRTTGVAQGRCTKIQIYLFMITLLWVSDKQDISHTWSLESSTKHITFQWSQYFFFQWLQTPNIFPWHWRNFRCSDWIRIRRVHCF